MIGVVAVFPRERCHFHVGHKHAKLTIFTLRRFSPAHDAFLSFSPQTCAIRSICLRSNRVGGWGTSDSVRDKNANKRNKRESWQEGKDASNGGRRSAET